MRSAKRLISGRLLVSDGVASDLSSKEDDSREHGIREPNDKGHRWNGIDHPL